MNQITLGVDKITCHIYIKDGMIVMDQGHKFVLRKGIGNALNSNGYTAINENGKSHPDIVDKPPSEFMQYTMERIKNRYLAPKLD